MPAVAAMPVSAAIRSSQKSLPRTAPCAPREANHVKVGLAWRSEGRPPAAGERRQNAQRASSHAMAAEFALQRPKFDVQTCAPRYDQPEGECRHKKSLRCKWCIGRAKCCSQQERVRRLPRRR